MFSERISLSICTRTMVGAAMVGAAMLGAAMTSGCSPAKMKFYDANGNAVFSGSGSGTPDPNNGQTGTGGNTPGGNTGGTGSGGTGGAGTVANDATSLAKACADNAARLKAQSFPVNFPRPAMGCAWGTNGNLNMRDAHFQARYEQVSQVQLPPNSVICNLQFRFANQPFYYDDEFMFTFNGVVMAASVNPTNLLTASNGLHQYDWLRMVGQPWTRAPFETWCAGRDSGLATCSFPATSTTGQISLNYSPALVNSVAARAISTNVHELRWIITGDNDDPVDCRHEPVDLDVDVLYLEL